MRTRLNEVMSPAGGGWGWTGKCIPLKLVFKADEYSHFMDQELLKDKIRQSTPYPRQRGTSLILKLC
jgi:hypothetical protein